MKKIILIIAIVALIIPVVLVGAPDHKLKCFGIWVPQAVFLANTNKACLIAIDMWASTDYEWKADPKKVNIWDIAVHEPTGKTGMLYVVTFQQVKDRVTTRSNLWKQVLSSDKIKWDVGYDIVGDNDLKIIGTWTP